MMRFTVQADVDGEAISLPSNERDVSNTLQMVGMIALNLYRGVDGHLGDVPEIAIRIIPRPDLAEKA